MRWQTAMTRAAEFSVQTGCRYRVYGERFPFGWRYFIRPTS